MVRHKLLLTVLALSVILPAAAQNGTFGYLDFNGTMKMMPAYIEASKELGRIQDGYTDELNRSKELFERQYIEFMIEQDGLSPVIVAKRQKELQTLMEGNRELRDRMQADLEAERIRLLNPLKISLLQAISDVCRMQDLDYVIDSGSGAYLSVNPEHGRDISHDIYRMVGIEDSTLVSETANSEGMIPVEPAGNNRKQTSEE